MPVSYSRDQMRKRFTQVNTVREKSRETRIVGENIWLWVRSVHCEGEREKVWSSQITQLQYSSKKFLLASWVLKPKSPERSLSSHRNVLNLVSLPHLVAETSPWETWAHSLLSRFWAQHLALSVDGLHLARYSSGMFYGTTPIIASRIFSSIERPQSKFKMQQQSTVSG